MAELLLIDKTSIICEKLRKGLYDYSEILIEFYEITIITISSRNVKVKINNNMD